MMRNGSCFIVVLFVLSIGSLAQVRLQPPPPAEGRLIHAGRILDVRSGTYLLDQGILTDGERIKEIGRWAEVQAHATKDSVVVDLSPATLLPGLIDCHAHLLISGDPRLAPGEILITTIAQASPSLRVLMGARNAREALVAGITSARIVGHSGVDGDVALRDAINAGWIPGPRLQAAARKITPRGGQALATQSAMAEQILNEEFLTASTPDEARAAVRENFARGADLIKIVVDAGITSSGKMRYMALEDARAVVQDARRLGLKVAAHAEDNIAVQTAIDAGVDSIEHAWSATEAQLRQMKDKGIFLVATELFYTTSPKDRLLRAIKVGVNIAMGSDAWTQRLGKTRGEATLLELIALQTEGMPNLDIIRSSTVTAAELMGWSDRGGELVAGKFADIIAVVGDPARDIGLLQQARFVMKGGTVIKNDFAKN